jgi:hypothetical protein
MGFSEADAGPDRNRSESTMADDIQIRCINKTDRQSAHERIRAIGGLNPNGTRWNLTVSEAIAGIKAGKWTFWTSASGVRANVIIAKTEQGHEYLKTVSDGVHPNNLLALPECP